MPASCLNTNSWEVYPRLTLANRAAMSAEVTDDGGDDNSPTSHTLTVVHVSREERVDSEEKSPSPLPSRTRNSLTEGASELGERNLISRPISLKYPGIDYN